MRFLTDARRPNCRLRRPSVPQSGRADSLSRTLGNPGTNSQKGYTKVTFCIERLLLGGRLAPHPSKTFPPSHGCRMARNRWPATVGQAVRHGGGRRPASMGTRTRQARGPRETPHCEADRARRWGWRRTRSEPTRPAVIGLVARAADRSRPRRGEEPAASSGGIRRPRHPDTDRLCPGIPTGLEAPPCRPRPQWTEPEE